MSANKVFGIDLGTTYSCISQVDRYGRPEVISNMDSDPTTPSVVLFEGDDVVVGKQAKRQARIIPTTSPSWSSGTWATPTGASSPAGASGRRPASPRSILGALANDAERATGERVTDVVITVPAYFGDEERKETKLAGEYAGLNVVDIINEPTAAAFAYGFAQEGAADETVLVYDLGGGTFDITVIALAGRRIQVVATDGDHELGGADWDDRLATHPVRALHGARPRRRGPARRLLRRPGPHLGGRGGQADPLAAASAPTSSSSTRPPGQHHASPGTSSRSSRPPCSTAPSS